jgi:osmotically-inducible protein OsmY
MTQPASPVELPPPDDAENTGMEATAVHVAEILEDLRLIQDVERALHATGHLPLRDIKVSCGDRVVTLDGHVPTYYLKQIAQAAALGILGVEVLRNDLEVESCISGRSEPACH